MILRKKYILIIQFICLSVLLNSFIYSQNEGMNSVDVARSQYLCARLMTDNLSNKLSLSPVQKKAMINILLDYQEDIHDLSTGSYYNSDFQNETRTRNDDNLTGTSFKAKTQKLKDTEVETNEKIVSILSGKQLSTYYRVKNDWWAHLKRITSHK